MSIRAVVLAAALTASALVTVVAPASAAAIGGKFVPAAQRVLDTRDGTGVQVEGDHLVVDLSHVVDPGSTAVVLNVTGADANVDSFVTVWPHGQARPGTSNLNVSRGQTAANLATVGLPAPDERVDLWVHGDLGVVVDVAGFYSPTRGSGFLSFSPHRQLDTRTAGGPVGPDGTTVLDLTKEPDFVTAVALNLTATDTTDNTYVTAWPDGSDRPAVSSMNVGPGQTRANMVIVPLPPSRKINLYNHSGRVNLIADLSGIYVKDGGNSFYSVPPKRVVDTRDSAPLEAGGVLNVNLGDYWYAVVNITATNATANTFLTIWDPQRDPRPDASTLNVGPGETVPNMAVASGTNGVFSVYNHLGRVDVIVDLAGYFGS
ncbi:hypothetical protein [Kutzneria sp. CA-103260]|uniref:hypothetical protein n=1 Tax=Kutzneria sp. CA-103260 TaxID=2802641 RepID=UPI001BA8DD5F|nr:hypothetical protein [Kutzneria sp. CA-103260]QUQ68623.1 hypothetical protein JJ691_63700 [Kutzneria sp. CA-103260]